MKTTYLILCIDLVCSLCLYPRVLISLIYYTITHQYNDIVQLITSIQLFYLNLHSHRAAKYCRYSYLKMKWNESGFRPPLCTYRLNWARRTSWGWWDDWDDTVLQTQDSKFEPWRSEAEHATSRSRRLPAILTFTRGWGRNIFVSFKPPRPGTEPRTLAWKAAVLTTTLGPPPYSYLKWVKNYQFCRIFDLSIVVYSRSCFYKVTKCHLWRRSVYSTMKISKWKMSEKKLQGGLGDLH